MSSSALSDRYTTVMLLPSTPCLFAAGHHVLTDVSKPYIAVPMLLAKIYIPAVRQCCVCNPCCLLMRRFLTSISFVPNPSLYPEPPVQGYAAAALGAVALSQVCCSHLSTTCTTRRAVHSSALSALPSLCL